MSKKSVAVRIAGHEYKILTDGDGDSLRQIAADVDRAMKRVRDRTGTVDTLDVAVLTCLNLAREIIDLRNQSTAAASDSRLRELIDRVEALLPNREETATQSGTVGEDVSQEAGRGAGARTLDLPSVEALRDRTSAAKDNEAEAADAPMPRVASGGRDRAS